MNRRARREHDRRHRRLDRRIHAMLGAAYADRKPWSIDGLTDGCADCDSVATICGTPGSCLILAAIQHDDSCPTYRGITPWTLVP